VLEYLDQKLPRIGAGIRDAVAEGYDRRRLRTDVLAGVTVGIVALPLAMALAIASGVPPQHGLYTVIVAGIAVALLGGSRVNVSGPTAAFVVILLPVTHQFGIGGLLVATVMSGLILLAMGLGRLGRFIEFVPYPITIGFTSGIGVVIATIQLRDFLGLPLESLRGDYLAKLGAIAGALPGLHPAALAVGAVTLAVLIAWPYTRINVPRHLVALVIGSLVAWAGGLVPGFHVATIASEFQWTLDGVSGTGIPPAAPHFAWPWQLAGPDGAPAGLSFELVRALAGPAFAIAMLGAIESLLCAVVADGMAGTRHDPNAELVGLGIGNVLAPFFGGIPATAAIARTATGIRAGARSPVAALVHALVVLAAVISLAPLLGRIPLAALAALLLVVAWNMSEARHFVRILRVAPVGDRVVLVTVFLLTVLFDMVLAVAVGMVLAALLFIKRTIDLTETRLRVPPAHEHAGEVPARVAVYDINGPLFFGAAHKALKILHEVDPGVGVVILDMRDVSMVDMTAIVALESIATNLDRAGIGLILNELEPRLVLKLRRAGVRRRSGRVEFGRSFADSLARARRMANGPPTEPGPA